MLDRQYPTLVEWILSDAGWIELGWNEYSDPFVRIFDIGGLLWESERDCETLAAALVHTLVDLIWRFGFR